MDSFTIKVTGCKNCPYYKYTSGTLGNLCYGIELDVDITESVRLAKENYEQLITCPLKGKENIFYR